MRSSGSFFAVWQSHRKKVKLQLQRQLIASLRTGGGGEEEEEDIVMDVEQVQNLLEQLGDSAHCTALESALWLGWLPRLSAVWCGVGELHLGGLLGIHSLIALSAVASSVLKELPQALPHHTTPYHTAPYHTPPQKKQ